MRTERTNRQDGCCWAFLHVSDIRPGKVTASDCASRYPAAPVLLPESAHGFCIGVGVWEAGTSSLVRLASWRDRAAIPVLGEDPEPASAAMPNAAGRQVSGENQPALANLNRAPGARVIIGNGPELRCRRYPVR